MCPVSTCWCGNENQALRIVDQYYYRTRTLRVFQKYTMYHILRYILDIIKVFSIEIEYLEHK
jgi:hypothetical protein